MLLRRTVSKSSSGASKQLSEIQKISQHRRRVEQGSLMRLLDDESHDEDCNGDGATEVGNVRVESFHAASAGYRSLLFFLWPMAKA